MKPTAPNGLQERWIIPILREVAVAIRWVHQAGIIHRDIKCKFSLEDRAPENIADDNSRRQRSRY